MRETYVIWATLSRGGKAVLQAGYSDFVSRAEMEERAEMYREKYPDAKLVVYIETDVPFVAPTETKLSGSLNTADLYCRPGRFISVNGNYERISDEPRPSSSSV